jgi:MFS family permease
MALAIVVGGLGAGPWVGRSGTRWPTVIGCLLGAAGILGARAELAGGSFTFGLLALALALAGLGFGITVVPLTAAVLSHVPARRSGMAASATNTARQLGAVVGVAALGAIVNHHLVATLRGSFGGVGRGLVPILETGGAPGSFTLDVIPQSFVDSFVVGLRLALLIAAALVLLAGVVAALVREPPVAAEDQTTETGATAEGSAPPSTSSNGSA